MTDLTNPINDPFIEAMLLPPQLSFFGYMQSADQIGISGTAIGFANGTEVNLLIVDIMGNSTSVIATIQGGSFVVADVDVSQFTPGQLTIDRQCPGARHNAPPNDWQLAVSARQSQYRIGCPKRIRSPVPRIRTMTS